MFRLWSPSCMFTAITKLRHLHSLWLLLLHKWWGDETAMSVVGCSEHARTEGEWTFVTYQRKLQQRGSPPFNRKLASNPTCGQCSCQAALYWFWDSILAPVELCSCEVVFIATVLNLSNLPISKHQNVKLKKMKNLQSWRDGRNSDFSFRLSEPKLC